MKSEAINYLLSWAKYLLILIPAGAGAMVTYQAVRKTFATGDEDVIRDANTKIRNTIKGAVIAMTIGGFIAIVKSYFS